MKRLFVQHLRLFFIFLLGGGLLLLFSPSSVFGAIDINSDPCDGGSCFHAGIDKEELPEELQEASTDGLTGAIVRAINYLLTFIGIILLVIIIYSGVLLIFSNGDDEALGKTKNRLLYALLGVVLIVMSYAIVRFITNIMTDPEQAIPGDSDGNSRGSGSSGGSGNENGENGGGTIGGGNEEIESQMQDILDEIADLKAQSGNDEAIDTLQKQLELLESELENDELVKSLEEELEELQSQLSELEKDTEDEEERKKLQEEIEKIENQIFDSSEDLTKELEELQSQLSELGEDTKDEEERKKLQEEIEKIENQISDSPEDLTKELEELQSQLSELEKDTEDEEERKKLQEEIEMIENQIFDSSKDLEQEVEDLLKKIQRIDEKERSLSIEDIDDLENLLSSLQEKAEGNESLEQDYTEIEKLLNELRDGRDDSKIVEEVLIEIEERIKELQKKTEVLSEVRPRVIISYGKRSVPTTVSLSGEKTYIKGPSNAIIKNSQYHWSVVGPDGVRKQIGEGITREYPLDIAGRYVFFLTVDSPAEDVLGAEGVQSFTAQPRETEVAFTIGEKTSYETLRFTKTQNEKGIIFTPSLVVPKSGRSIDRYVWNFGGYKVEETEGKSVLYTFPREGKSFVQLEVYDNVGKKSLSKKVSLEITSIDAYFRLKKSKYKLGEEIRFSAKSSVSDNGNIQEFDWEVLDEKGALIKEFMGEEFSTGFDTPGNYTAKLLVQDSTGESTSFIQSFMVVSDDPVAYFVAQQLQNSNTALWNFDASSSFDITGSELLYSWDFDGDFRYDEVDKTEGVIDYQFKKSGAQMVRLRVKNRYGKEDIFSQSITVEPLVEAEITSDKTLYTVDEVADFTAVSGMGKSFEWNFDDETGIETLSSKETTHVFSRAGTYLVSLTVKGRNGGEASATKKIVVRDRNKPGSVISVRVNGKQEDLQSNLCGPGKHGIEVFRSDTVSFSGIESVNATGKNTGLEYIWTLNKEEKKGGNISLSFAEVSSAGNCKSVSLSSKDVRSGEVSDPEFIWVFVKNADPQLQYLEVSDPQSTFAPANISVSARATDPDGTIVGYTWWAERIGSFSEEKIGVHTTKKPESVIIIPSFGSANQEHQYQFFVEVVDNNGVKVSSTEVLPASKTVMINNGNIVLPEGEITASTASALMGESVKFTAFITNDGTDVSSFASYKWDFDGDGVFERDSITSSISYQYEVAGSYTPTVKALYQGNVIEKSTSLTIENILKMPQALFTVQKMESGSFVFSAESSKYDKSIEGNALQYFWDFNSIIDTDNDGVFENDKNANGSRTEYMYPSETTEAIVSLTVVNANGESDTVRQKLNFENISGITITSVQESEIIADTLLQKIEKTLTSEGTIQEENLNEVQEVFDLLDTSAFNNEQQELFRELQENIEQWENEQSDEHAQSVQSVFEDTAESLGYEWESAPLLSDESLKTMSDLQNIFDIPEDQVLDPLDLEKVKTEIVSFSEEITEDNVLYTEYQDLKNSVDILEQEPDNRTALNTVQEKLSILQEKEQSSRSSNIIWKPLEELGENINKSVQISSNTLATTLDVYGGERYITQGEDIIFFAFIKNADGTLYSGPLEVIVSEGEGTLHPPVLKAISGRGVGSFTPTTGGVTVLKITAPQTLSGSLSETLTFFVEE